MDIDGADITLEIISPDGIEKGLTALDAAGILHQKLNEIKFFGG